MVAYPCFSPRWLPTLWHIVQATLADELVYDVWSHSMSFSNDAAFLVQTDVVPVGNDQVRLICHDYYLPFTCLQLPERP